MISKLTNGSIEERKKYSARMAEFIRENGLNPPDESCSDITDTDIAFISQFLGKHIRAQIDEKQTFSNALFTTYTLRNALSLYQISNTIHFLLYQYLHPKPYYELWFMFKHEDGKVKFSNIKMIEIVTAPTQCSEQIFKMLRNGTDAEQRYYADLMSCFIKLYGLVPGKSYIAKIDDSYVPLPDKEIEKLYYYANHYTDAKLEFTEKISFKLSNVFSRQKTLYKNLKQTEISEIIYRILQQEYSTYVFKLYGDKLLLDKDTFQNKINQAEYIPFDESIMLV
ncbi:MAG: hypothetical protein ACK5WS_02175 [Alphaproteobacteria bacterium]|nr:hypothetical protein [Candidatus Jidaibacter sp.]